MSVINFNNIYLQPDTLMSVASNTGELAQQKKGAVGQASQEDVFRPAQDHALLLKEHGLELAQQTGATHLAHEDEGKIQDRKERDREHDIAEEDRHESQGHTVISPKGVSQTLGDEEHERLKQLDSNLFTKFDLNRDVKPESLSAAQRMVESQPAKKNAQLKPVPEAEEAMRPELAAAPMLTKPLDICAAGSDKQVLINVDPSEFELSVAQNHAADLLASGAPNEQMIVG